jgi:hypothetical protein
MIMQTNGTLYISPFQTMSIPVLVFLLSKPQSLNTGDAIVPTILSHKLKLIIFNVACLLNFDLTILCYVTMMQMDYLTHWAALETEHSTSLSSAIEALRASTLRLPVTGGAKADVFTVKNAVSSAVDIMQAMGSSVCYLLSKVELKDPHLVKLVCFSICKMSCLFCFDDGSPVTTITL